MLVTSLFKAGLKTKFYKNFFYDKEFTGNSNIDEKKVISKTIILFFLIKILLKDKYKNGDRIETKFLQIFCFYI